MLKKIMKASIQTKILILPVLFLIGFLTLLLANLVLDNMITNTVVFPQFRNQILKGHQNMMKTIVDVEATYLGLKMKALQTREEKTALIIAETDPIRFLEDGSGYFFTYDTDGVRINVPINKSQNGQNCIALEDKKGFRFVEAFVKTAKAGGGFVEYYFEKEGKGIQPKLSYAKIIPGTDFLIGTGVYIDNVEEETNALKGQISSKNREYFLYKTGIFLMLLVLIILLSVLIARAISSSIQKIITGLTDEANQVAAAATEVSSSSQSLAEGASEQASALEETSSSLEEMSSMTKRNADNAAQAKALTHEAKQIVEKVDDQMHRMVTAIQEVTKSSEETGKIIKTIDEIAFQTNLLALNAAVEAARAGEAGAGFAVVADEVRNLAMRAAEAAKNTSNLIENTIVTVKNSRDLTEQTQNAFKENVEISSKIGQLIDEIAAASSEQAQGIGQIGKAVAEMDKVVQQTAANAEESASASEEMSAQAMQMNKDVEQLVAIVEGAGSAVSHFGSHEQLIGEEKSAARKYIKPGERKKLTTRPAIRTTVIPVVRPEKVIPLEKEDFKDF